MTKNQNDNQSISTGGKGLGKGLNALLDDASYETPKPTEDQFFVAVEKLTPSGYQPRHYFDEEQLNALAGSIKSQGVLQPLLIRKIDGQDSYEIIAGERRWRASQLAGLDEVPAIQLNLTDGKALEVALVENIQRSDLNPIDEAAGYLRLVNDFGYTHEDMSRVTGKSRSHITNLLRLLSLPERIKDLVAQHKLSMGHARTLLGLEDEEQQMRCAMEVMKKGLSVRETEEMVRKIIQEEKGEAPKRTRTKKDMATKELESHLTQKLGLGVNILKKGKSGTLRIDFKSEKDLEGILLQLGVES